MKAASILALMMVAGALNAQENFGPGASSSRWLNLTLAGPASGASGSSLIQSNPAGLTQLENTDLRLNRLFWPQGLSLQQLSVAAPLGRKGWGGLALDYMNYGHLERTQLNAGGSPEPAGTIQADSLALRGAWAYAFPGGWSAGLSAGSLNENLDKHSESSTLFGASFEFRPGKGSYFVSASNVGTTVFGSSPPARLDAGAAYPWPWQGHPLTITAGAYWIPNDSEGLRPSAGLIYQAREPLLLRLDYRLPGKQSPGGLSGGFTWSLGRLKLEYRFLPTLDRLPPGHWLGLSWIFDPSLASKTVDQALKEQAAAPEPSPEIQADPAAEFDFESLTEEP